jgi:hypothetical protein
MWFTNKERKRDAAVYGSQAPNKAGVWDSELGKHRVFDIGPNVPKNISAEILKAFNKKLEFKDLDLELISQYEVPA